MKVGSAPASRDPPIGIIALNLGGPGSLDDVEPFLRRLFADPDVIQLGWARPLQPLFARLVARRRAPFSREAYAQIGGRSPILEETSAQATAVASELAHRGYFVQPAVAMAAWQPTADDAIADLVSQGVSRAVALPLYPHESRATTGSSLKQLERARRRREGFEIAAITRYPDAEGYLRAVEDRVRDAIATLPPEHRDSAPVLFSAHGLPEPYIKRGDPYLDDVRITTSAVTRRLSLDGRARLCFQSKIGRQRWLGPATEEVLHELSKSGARAVVVVPIAFTGEHIETLQEIDILYREQAEKGGIVHFARARTVGCHSAFVSALADLVEAAVRERGWA
jgi:ferrochelatase